jgi:hypothetical protein
MTRNQLRALAAIVGMLAVALVALPVLGVDPSPSASTGALPSEVAPSVEPSAGTFTEPSEAPPSAEPSADAPAPATSAEPVEPDESGEPDEDSEGNGNGQKADKEKAPEHPVTLTGIVGRSSGEDADYTLVVGLKVYRLSAGPHWWWGDANPLAAVFGKNVTIDGEQEEGSDEVDVLKIDGKAIREPGRPPWAGGWKVVGPKHPGWAQWKVDKADGNGHGRDSAPGQLEKDDATP